MNMILKHCNICALILISLNFILIIIFSTAKASFGNTTKTKADEEFKKNKDNSKIPQLKNLIDKKHMLMPSILMWDALLLLFFGSLLTILYINAFKDLNCWLTALFLILTFLFISFAKILCSMAAALNSYKISLFLAPAFTIICAVTFPFINLFFAILNPLFAAFGADIKKEYSPYTEEELKLLVKESHRRGVIEKDDHELIHSVFEFGDTIAKEVMTPRMDMLCIQGSASLRELIQFIKKYEFSKIPVYGASIDNILGIVHLIDVLNVIEENKTELLAKDIARAAKFIPANKKISELLKEMQKEKVTMSIVVDEYGGTEGLITIEDMLEEIVGEISDEYDEAAQEFLACEDGSYVVNAKLVIEDVNSKLKLNISTKEFETIGGFAYGLFDKVPNEGDSIRLENFTLTIEKTAGKRISKIRIKKREETK